MQRSRLLELLDKLDNESITNEERTELYEWYDSLNLGSLNSEPGVGDQSKEVMLAEFRSRYAVSTPRGRLLKIRWRTLKVAAVAAGLIFGILFYTNVKRPTRDSIVNNVQTAGTVADVAPGNTRAVLILGDGSTIDLHKSLAGTLAQQGSTEVRKRSDGTIDYVSNTSEKQGLIFNTVQTPRGGEYKLVLADGTNVWLNASSSLKFPTAFSGAERRVEVSGEAYFEVAENKDLPFVVSVNGRQEVRVLGTHFNVNAYLEDGLEKVTLLEGSVAVAQGKYAVTLKPGQQSFLAGKGFEIEDADVDQVIAWKTGFFEFNNSSLESIMQSISRWYDVDVIYEMRSAPAPTLGGRISRHLPLSKVLKMLSAYGIYSKIVGKSVVISN